MQPNPLTNLEIQKHYLTEPKFNGVYARNNLPKIKDGAYVLNLDDFKLTGTHWVVLYVNGNNATYFDRFGLSHILKEVKEFMGNKNITNIYRKQAYDLIVCGYFSIGFLLILC